MSGARPRHEPLPGFYDGQLARFAPAPGARRTGILLLRLLGVPGMRRLLLAWHARRR